MASPRSEQIDLSVTRFYHCMSRCVRRAFLCGDDHYSGQNYNHRKVWVADRLRYLASIFAIDICAYAVMENHLHVILAIDEDRASSWSEQEIVARYTRLYPMARAAYETVTSDDEVAPLLQTWRNRLSDLSWMMRALNEYIARKANKEEKVHGRFWEGRFKSQALVDEKGLLTAMAYVDLNPVRAGKTDSLTASEFTSIQDRIEACTNIEAPSRGSKPHCPAHLAPMLGEHNSDKGVGSIPLNLRSYIELLEWTGQEFAPGKSGKLATPIVSSVSGAEEMASPADKSALLREYGISPQGFLAALRDHRVGSVRFLGSEASLEELATDMNKRWVRGIGLARSLAPVLL